MLRTSLPPGRSTSRLRLATHAWRPRVRLAGFPVRPTASHSHRPLELAVPCEQQPRRAKSAAREALPALAAMAAVVVFGLLWGWLGDGTRLAAPGPTTPYVDEAMPDSTETRIHPSPKTSPAGAEGALPGPGLAWLIDGFNLLHAGLLSPEERQGPWWKQAARSRVVDAVAAVAPRLAAREISVVFDGSREPDDAVVARDDCDALRLVFAPCADDWLLAQTRDREAATGLAAVTADRRLANRLRHRGARVLEPRAFLALARPLPSA